MKVGIDTFDCGHGKNNAGMYLNSILKNLPQSKIDGPLDIELFGLESDRDDFEDFISDVSQSSSEMSEEVKVSYFSVELPATPSGVRLWHAFGCNSFFRKQGYDVVIFLGISFLPVKCQIPSVLIVNDLLTSKVEALPFYSRMKLRVSLRNFKKIIVPTQFVKKELKAMHLHSDSVSVVHNGLDHSIFYPRASDSEIVDIKPFAVQKPYFIYVSKMSSPLKRHCELIKAFSEFKARSNLPHRLVLAGGEGSCFEQVQKAAIESPFATDIFITGYYPHENYPELYAGAEACIYPSVCESVGMPVIEAMAMGIPVACAKNGGIPEVAGENAIYFDGNSIPEMSSAMEKLSQSDDASVASRKKMAENALSWSARFTWKKTCEDVFAEAKKILSKKR